MFTSVTNFLVILVVLAGLIYLGLKFINPSKYLNKTRDQQRISDLAKIQTALDLYIADNKNFDKLKFNQIYDSASNQTGLDGSGWLPLNLLSASVPMPISFLPVDPLNKDGFYYQIGVNPQAKTYEIDCRLESADYSTKAKNDGGNNLDFYEIGSDLSILK